MCQEPGPTRLQVAGGSGLLCPNRLDIDQASDVLSLITGYRDEYGQIGIILKLGLNHHQVSVISIIQKFNKKGSLATEQ